MKGMHTALFIVMMLAGLSNGGTWTSPQQSPGGAGWVMLYKQDSPLGWNAAQSIALNAKGTLSESTTTAMNDFLHQVAVAADLQACDGPWLGGQRQATSFGSVSEGWVWSDGAPFVFTSWSGDQPAGSTWLDWFVRLDANPTVESTWAATPRSSAGGTAVHSLLASFTLPPDCDGNGQPDAIDIAESPGLDADGDGFIDGCCPSDVTGDARVDVADLLQVLAVWNLPGADLDGDGVTDVDDLLQVIDSYGCEPSAG